MYDLDPKNYTGQVLEIYNLPFHRINWNDSSSLYNWIEQFKLECAPKNEIGMFGSLCFFGLVIGALIMPRLSDNYGRKKISLSGTFGHIISGIGILFSSSLIFSLLMSFILGFCLSGRALVGYCWLTEHMNSK